MNGSHLDLECGRPAFPVLLPVAERQLCLKRCCLRSIRRVSFLILDLRDREGCFAKTDGRGMIVDGKLQTVLQQQLRHGALVAPHRVHSVLGHRRLEAAGAAPAHHLDDAVGVRLVGEAVSVPEVLCEAQPGGALDGDAQGAVEIGRPACKVGDALPRHGRRPRLILVGRKVLVHVIIVQGVLQLVAGAPLAHRLAGTAVLADLADSARARDTRSRRCDAGGITGLGVVQRDSRDIRNLMLHLQVCGQGRLLRDREALHRLVDVLQ
mmetsp:Transcript_35055/g.90052  ORF Transcript_35055/g.90052 Transcript_35055/m.90052 type:complete len:266 (-) Transcript_35055:1687-2484(-)